MASTRRLAAILAADVAGYSRLMGADEEGTHERLRAHLRDLVDPKIKEHHGRTVKNTGDGLLAEFASVVDAVRCGVEVQEGMAERNAAIPLDNRIDFRIGVNLGDVIVEDDDIYGDGVNIAARLEALAEPGGIFISRTVRDQIRDKLPYPFEDRGGAERQEHCAASTGLCVATRSPRRSAGRECTEFGTASPAQHRPSNRRDGCNGARHRCDHLVGLACSNDNFNGASGQRGNRHPYPTALRRTAPVDCRATVRQSRQRSRPAIFCGWDHRRFDNRSVTDQPHASDLARQRLHL